MSADALRLVWLNSLQMHSRAALLHELAAERFSGLGDEVGLSQAERERERAGAERQTCGRLLARHPEWKQDARDLREAGLLIPAG
jgi:hypothetical protein